MFKKPVASLKSFSPLRSSDKRRLRDEIIAAFPSFKDMDPIDDTPINAIITPDGLQSARFTSYIEEPGTLYTDPHGTPLWFKISTPAKKDSLILPSIYTLWKFPTLIPALTTWNPVLDKLRNGADLMIPGVITAAGTPVPDLDEGSLVVVLARGNKYPLAIGTMAVSGQAIASSRGSQPPKGKAVHILHVHQDQLWAMGPKSELPSDWSLTKVPLDDEEYESSNEDNDENDTDNDDSLAKDIGAVSVAESKGKEPTRDEPIADTEPIIPESSRPVEEPIVLSTEEVDKYLQDALLQVLKFKITEDVSKELLPMNASTLYSSYVLPNRAPGRAAEADIKKSSWKKAAKWFKAVEKQDLVKCKEIKGELFLLSVNSNHPQLKEFKGQKTVEQQAARQAKVEAKISQENAAVHSLEVLEAYRPNSTSSGLFEATGRSKDGYYSLQELRAMLAAYIKEKQLSDPKNQRFIRPDEILRAALSKKGEQLDRVPRDETSDRLVNNMVHHHFIGYKDQQPRFVKGGIKPIQIVQEIRSGRKTVTKVSGLELFLIDVDAFSQEIQLLCASSVSVTPLVGASPKLNLKEVMVQGPQSTNVTSVLINKGIPKKYIEFLDKTSKKNGNNKVKHVVLLSIDSFYENDLAVFTAANSKSTLATLVKTGIEFTNAQTTKPSDSFPRLIAQLTGGTPISAGVWYDDSYDRSLYAPGTDCAGASGTEILFDETIDIDDTKINGGGGINHTGAYDIARGACGQGLTELYSLEIASVPVTGNATAIYDDLHVNATLNWTQGKDAAGVKHIGVPFILGSNFQAVSVTQTANGTPSSELTATIQHTDASIGKIVSGLKAAKIYEKAIIIIVPVKHGNSPHDVSKPKRVDPAILPSVLGVVEIAQSELGTLFSLSEKKIAEHGGFNEDDIHVALLVSFPHIKALKTRGTIDTLVKTTQVALTVLKLLGLNPDDLEAVKLEGTARLPIF
ncbi:hypothetical protein BGX21_001364 [Mortierella sp. AD011]|nr:hypothetical protein BGX21_001364 [Mortierella sp. AD011]